MTLRTAGISLVLFLIAFFASIALFVPVQLLIEWAEPELPENLTIQSSQGRITQGSVVLTSPLFEQPLPVEWESCVIGFVRPIGFCLFANIKAIDLMFALQPWSLGQEARIYNISFNTDIAKIAQLHPSLSILSAAQGGVVADVEKLVVATADKRILDIDGELQLTNGSVLGLQFGTVNATFSSEGTDDNIAIVIALEGGTTGEIKLQGSGRIDPTGNLKMRFLFRTSNASIQQQLAVITKKISETEYQFDYASKIF